MLYYLQIILLTENIILSTEILGSLYIVLADGLRQIN